MVSICIPTFFKQLTFREKNLQPFEIQARHRRLFEANTVTNSVTASPYFPGRGV